MSRDQLQILESSANRKASVSPSPNTVRGLADLNLTGSEDQTDTSLEPGEVRGGEEGRERRENNEIIPSQYRGGQVTCLDNFPDSLQPGRATGLRVSSFNFYISLHRFNL